MAYIPNKADEQGKSNWQPGDKITPANLNHIEDGLVAAAAEADKKELPSAGDIGQVLTKTLTGVAWTTIEATQYEAGTGINIADDTISIDTAVTATKSDLTSKQDVLVSGTSIKTINNTSLLGAGDISIQGGLTQELTTGYAIGGIPVGKVYPSGTTFETILRDMLIYVAPPIYDLYIGAISDKTSREFKDLANEVLIAAASPYDLNDTPVIWSPTAESQVFFMLVKADNLAIVKDGKLVSGGLTTEYTFEDITAPDSTAWKGNGHANVVINDISYRVCGLANSSWATTDRVTINFNK